MTSGSFPSTSSESQLQRYLNEDPIGFDKGYDILTWWKNNAVRFPIVARMARDILGMQISTVASESTFSNGRRVITDYRTNLSVVIVEALICTQDWLIKSSLPIYDYDEVHDVLADDDLAIGKYVIKATHLSFSRISRTPYMFGLSRGCDSFSHVGVGFVGGTEEQEGDAYPSFRECYVFVFTIRVTREGVSTRGKSFGCEQSCCEEGFGRKD
uniref:HAT C-terminal dimerisation domain-containing protein n=1 Tax=Lactuca sativa TaxID=4236 RepID=A0A9R1W7R1_LACSA|nr:hypothetical protein LSAT_V11C300128810 [Lactuca sativa]